MEEQVQQAEQQVVEQEAIERYRETQKSQEELANEVPEGYNPDGTPKEEAPILGKFKSQEDLVKAYQELEKKLGQPKETPQPQTEQKQEEVVVSGVNVTKYNTELVETGSLSDASYKELEKVGFTRTDVDRYIAGQKALAEQFTSTIYNLAGGQEGYTSLVSWASDNMPEATIQEYNTALANGDTTKVSQLLEYMSFKKGNTAPSAPRRLEGQATADTGGIQPFQDKTEWYKATGNRLYGKDIKYTNMVDRRYLASRQKGLL